MPFGGLLIAGAASLLPAVIKGVTAANQRKAAGRLRQTDVTPIGQQENLAAARLAAASGRMPGQDVAEAQINQSTSAALNAARSGATGGSSVLAALGRGNGQRLAALSGLNTRVQGYQEAARGRLAQANAVQGGYDEKSRSEYNNAVTSLNQAAAENEMGAVTDVANTGATIGGSLLDKGAGGVGASGAAGVAADGSLTPLTLGQKLMLRRKFGAASGNIPLRNLV